MNWLTWDEVYQNWDRNDPLRRYWEQWQLEIVERQ
jgi:hypothetical protein